MSDLAGRLRAAADGGPDSAWWWDSPDRGGPGPLLEEAAEAVERMTAALQEIEQLATAALTDCHGYGIGLRGPVQKAAQRGLGMTE
jgi:hypothetical protein